MQWNKHFNLKNKHAILSPSQPAWVDYEDERFIDYLITKQAAERGTRLHAFAAEAIELGIKQAVPRGKIKTLESYINDGIGYHMDVEVPLFYSDNVFGTADAISFRNGKLRIHDLKTGSGKIHPEQLIVYAALFCLEYKEDPEDLREITLCVYQNDEIVELDVTAEDIRHFMDEIIRKDKIIKTRQA